MLIVTLGALPALPEPPQFLCLLWPLPFGKRDVFPAILNAAEIAPSWFVTTAPSTHLACPGSRRQLGRAGLGQASLGQLGDLGDPGKVLVGVIVLVFPLQDPSRTEKGPEGQSCYSHPG